MDFQESGSPSRPEEQAGLAGASGETRRLPLPVIKPPRRRGRRLPAPVPRWVWGGGAEFLAQGGALEEEPLNPALR